MFGSSLPPVVCRRALYLCLFAYSGVQHILCCVFVLFFFIMLQVFLDCPFFIAPSVFSNMYFNTRENVSNLNCKGNCMYTCTKFSIEKLCQTREVTLINFHQLLIQELNDNIFFSLSSELYHASYSYREVHAMQKTRDSI